jgi:predicted nuclease of predicted toxin-antitoxin system
MQFLSDENFNRNIVRGILRKEPTLDIVRVQDTEIYQSDDPAVLEWAAQKNRIVLTHDKSTMSDFAYERISGGKPMPGVIIAHQNAPIGQIIEDLLTIIGASEAAEYENKVTYLPLTPSNP